MGIFSDFGFDFLDDYDTEESKPIQSKHTPEDENWDELLADFFEQECDFLDAYHAAEAKLIQSKHTPEDENWLELLSQTVNQLLSEKTSKLI